MARRTRILAGATGVGRVRRVVLTEADSLARRLLPGFQHLLGETGVVVALGPP